jgi:hypothetical protein
VLIANPCDPKSQQSSVHRFSKNSKILEGSWVEGGEEGMWKIILKKRARNSHEPICENSFSKKILGSSGKEVTRLQ